MTGISRMVRLGQTKQALARSHGMSTIQPVILVIGLLATIVLAATVAGILLHRAFPDNQWDTPVGPLGAAAAVLALARVFFRK